LAYWQFAIKINLTWTDIEKSLSLAVYLGYVIAIEYSLVFAHWTNKSVGNIQQ